MRNKTFEVPRIETKKKNQTNKTFWVCEKERKRKKRRLIKNLPIYSSKK
jgi:hypothetical protein